MGWDVLPLKRLTVVSSDCSNLLPDEIGWLVKAVEISVVDKSLQLNSRSSQSLSSSLTMENQGSDAALLLSSDSST